MSRASAGKNSASPSVQVAVALIRAPDGRVLVALRNPQGHLPGVWECPGGKIEATETAEAALTRELREELGVVFLPASRAEAATIDRSAIAIPAVSGRVPETFASGVWPCEGAAPGVLALDVSGTERTAASDGTMENSVSSAKPGGVLGPRILTIRHSYPDRDVELHVFRAWVPRALQDAIGTQGREGQALRWVAPEALATLEWPAANGAIATAAQLPECYPITPDPGTDAEAWMAAMPRWAARARDAGWNLLQMRAPFLDASQRERAYFEFAEHLERCGWAGDVVVNVPRAELCRYPVTWGWHAAEREWRRSSMAAEADAQANRWWSASVHDAAGLRALCDLQSGRPRFAVLGPVRKTPTHPGASALGESVFETLAGCSPVPLYALGGMKPGDTGEIRARGGQGVAGIRGFFTTE